MVAADLIMKAKSELVLYQPFFASIALRLLYSESTDCKTACVNGKEIKYNPAFVESLTLGQVKGVLAHEVLHVANCHHTRRGSRDSKRWNIACDYAINDVLLASGFKLPEGALTGYGSDKSAEQIYEMLSQEQEQNQEQGEEGKEGSEQGQDGAGNGKDNKDPGNCGGVEDLPGNNGGEASPADMSKEESEVKVMVNQAATQARSLKNLPTAVERMIKEIVNPKVDWRELLVRFIQKTAKNDYSWMHPNKRHIHNGTYLPSLHSNELPEVVIAVDTSGSLGEKDLEQFSAEISSILQEFDTKITVIYCDSSVRNVQEFSSQDLPIKLEALGGGGTDFKPVFNWVSENDKNPAFLVYLTDLNCNSYPEEPCYPVLWVSNSDYYQAPFGETIIMK